VATITKFANANTVVTTGWTNPTNAYASDAVYATAAPAKNASVTTDYGFPAFTTTDIPAGSTINSVTAQILFKVSTTSSIATQGLQLNNNGTLLGTEATNTAEPTADTVLTMQVTTGITLADLGTANLVRSRVRGNRGNSTTAVTCSVDYAELTVDYTASANTTVTPGIGAMTATGLAPTVAVTNNVTVSPGVIALALAGKLSTVAAPRLVTPGVVNLSLLGLAPTITVSSPNVTVTPGARALTLSGVAATVTVTANVSFSPGAATLTFSAQSPTVAATNNIVISPGVLAALFTAFVPAVTGSATTVSITIEVAHDAALRARWALDAGKSFGVVASDHLPGETCAMAIFRLQDQNHERSTDGHLADIGQAAATWLTAGRGWNLLSSDHLAGETCVECIVRMTTS